MPGTNSGFLHYSLATVALRNDDTENAIIADMSYQIATHQSTEETKKASDC
ncbi:hypothetical protein [Nitrosomonas communis]|uniref:hypothetical protein n=1 Tax=Nitrosomonas communis TaxID=44574 RepID=UPI000AF9DFA8|nr:hypothetical protein [Nitrosomonas communis]